MGRRREPFETRVADELEAASRKKATARSKASRAPSKSPGREALLPFGLRAAVRNRTSRARARPLRRAPLRSGTSPRGIARPRRRCEPRRSPPRSASSRDAAAAGGNAARAASRPGLSMIVACTRASAVSGTGRGSGAAALERPGGVGGRSQPKRPERRAPVRRPGRRQAPRRGPSRRRPRRARALSRAIAASGESLDSDDDRGGAAEDAARRPTAGRTARRASGFPRGPRSGKGSLRTPPAKACGKSVAADRRPEGGPAPLEESDGRPCGASPGPRAPGLLDLGLRIGERDRRRSDSSTPRPRGEPPGSPDSTACRERARSRRSKRAPDPAASCSWIAR